MLLLSRYALQRAVFYAFGVQRPHRGAEKPKPGRVSAGNCFSWALCNLIPVFVSGFLFLE